MYYAHNSTFFYDNECIISEDFNLSLAWNRALASSRDNNLWTRISLSLD